MQYRIDMKPLPWQEPAPGVRHKQLVADSQVLRLVEYSPQMEPHWCERGHIGMILEGRFEIEFDGVTEIFEAGDGVFIPDGKEHRHRARALTEVVRAVFVETTC